MATGQTCFEAGECRESHHIQGESVTDQVQCLDNCKQEPGQIIFQFRVIATTRSAWHTQVLNAWLILNHFILVKQKM